MKTIIRTNAVMRSNFQAESCITSLNGTERSQKYLFFSWAESRNRMTRSESWIDGREYSLNNTNMYN